jgi:hypothetical protein
MMVCPDLKATNYTTNPVSPSNVTNYLHGDEPFSNGCQLYSYSRTSQHFIES